MTGSDTEPKTGAALLALPIVEPAYRQVARPGCSHTINIPVIRRAFARTAYPDSIVFTRDDEGTAWAPVLTEDGWFRERKPY